MFQWLKNLLKEKSKETKDFLWVSDRETCGPHLIGRPIELEGRKGKVVATTLLTITVKWSK